jgi:hypothetical protein
MTYAPDILKTYRALLQQTLKILLNRRPLSETSQSKYYCTSFDGPTTTHTFSAFQLPKLVLDLLTLCFGNPNLSPQQVKPATLPSRAASPGLKS